MNLREKLERARTAKERAEKATQGPWLQGHHVGEPKALVAAASPTESLLGLDRDDMAIVAEAHDAAFIAAARTDVPALAADVEELAAEVERMRPVVQAAKFWREGQGRYEGDALVLAVDAYTEKGGA